MAETGIEPVISDSPVHEDAWNGLGRFLNQRRHWLEPIYLVESLNPRVRTPSSPLDILATPIFPGRSFDRLAEILSGSSVSTGVKARARIPPRPPYILAKPTFYGIDKDSITRYAAVLSGRHSPYLPAESGQESLLARSECWLVSSTYDLAMKRLYDRLLSDSVSKFRRSHSKCWPPSRMYEKATDELHDRCGKIGPDRIRAGKIYWLSTRTYKEMMEEYDQQLRERIEGTSTEIKTILPVRMESDSSTLLRQREALR